MTIQNIEDVMDRIMSLNRNLTEESLKTLLSASGWDREDIMEGLRIFRTKNKNTVVATPIKSETIDTSNISENLPVNIEDKKEFENITNNVYSFNLKKKETESTPIQTENILSSNLTKEESTNNASNINIFPVGNKRKEEEDKNLTQNDFLVPVSAENNIKTLETKKSKSSGGFGKILFYILLILILGVLLSYILIPNFNNYINQKFLTTSNIKSNIIENQKPINLNTNKTKTEQNTSPIQDINYNNSISSTTNMVNVDIEELRKEIINLKSELEKYKNSGGEEKTVIKYISQRGPAGKNGRGIVNIEATSTGFLINYTDGTKDIAPYSTTTILSILNSENICFRDASSTPNMINTQNPDICLDRNSVLNLINRR